MKLLDEDYTFLALCTRELKLYMSSLEKAKLKDGIRYILAISRHGNQYMQSTQPWVLFKGSEQEKYVCNLKLLDITLISFFNHRERSGTIIGVCANIVALLSVLLYPYMPDTSRNIKKQLNASDDIYILTPE